MSREQSTLRRALDISLEELLGYDLALGALGAAGGIWLALESPDTVQRTAAVASQLIAAVVGAVIAGVAIIAAFMDQGFLRKLQLIEREPQRYVQPFAFTTVIGVIGFLGLMLVGGVPDSAPTWLRAVTTGGAGFFVVWAIVSLLPCMKLIIDFVGLKGDAARVPDDLVETDELSERRSC